MNVGFHRIKGVKKKTTVDGRTAVLKVLEVFHIDSPSGPLTKLSFLNRIYGPIV